MATTEETTPAAATETTQAEESTDPAPPAAEAADANPAAADATAADATPAPAADASAPAETAPAATGETPAAAEAEPPAPAEPPVIPRVVIVTGASSGLGLEVSRILSVAGHDVIMACRNEEKANRAIDKLKKQNLKGSLTYLHVCIIMPPLLTGGGIKRCFCLASVCLSSTWGLSREQRGLG